MTNKDAKEIYKTLTNIYCGVLANYPNVHADVHAYDDLTKDEKNYIYKNQRES